MTNILKLKWAKKKASGNNRIKIRLIKIILIIELKLVESNYQKIINWFGLN